VVYGSASPWLTDVEEIGIIKHLDLVARWEICLEEEGPNDVVE
jgi:hypothetical protein